MRVRLLHRALASHIAQSHLSQNGWAQRMGMSSGYLSLLVNGRRKYPGARTRQRLLRATGLKFEQLFEIEQPESPVSAPAPSSIPERESMLQLFNHARHAPARLFRQPGSTILAILALAIGIAGTTTVFSLVHGVLLKPFPYPDAHQVVSFWASGSWSKAEIEAMQHRAAAFSEIAGYGQRGITLTGRPEPVHLSAVFASPNLFSLLGRVPDLGSPFDTRHASPGSHRVVLLSSALWHREFGRDPLIVGRPIHLEGEEYQVLGVMPEDFFFPRRSAELWLPLEMDPGASDYRRAFQWSLLGRLREGVNRVQANATLASLGASMREEFRYPSEFDKFPESAGVVPLQTRSSGEIRNTLWLLMIAVVVVLLIACTNVVNLGFSRLAARQKEFALRTALGAGRLQLTGLILSENLLLAGLGGALGVLLAFAGLRFGAVWLPPGPFGTNAIALDPRVLFFAISITLLTGFLLGLLPAFSVARTDLRRALSGTREGAEGEVSRGSGYWLVTIQVALGLVMVTVAGIAFQNLSDLQQKDLGLETRDVFTWRTYPIRRELASRSGRPSFFEAVLQELMRNPGIQSAGAVQALPIDESGWIQPVLIEGREQRERVYWRTILGDYFQTMGIELRAGRNFTPADRGDGLSVGIVNEAFQRHFLPDQKVLGKRVRVSPDGDQWVTIVGVVEDVLLEGAAQAAPPVLYRPYSQNSMSLMLAFTVRSALPRAEIQRAARAAVSQQDPDAPLAEGRFMEEVVSLSVERERLLAALLGSFGFCALLLAALGTYSVISYHVLRRTYEFGVRLALGATRGDLMRLVLSRGLRLALVGTLLGSAGLLLLIPLLSHFLSIRAHQVVWAVAALLILLLTSLLSSFLPARKAAGLNPNQALRRSG